VVIPVYDEDHRRRGPRPWTMWCLFTLNVAVFIYLALLPTEVMQILALNFGVVPAFITKSVNTEELGLLIPPFATLVTYMFVHGNWLHLTGNMIFLWVLGDDIEAALGHARFFLFYLLCGIAGGVAHVASDPGAMNVVIGASGAIGGILAAYLMLRPWAHVTVLLFGLLTLRVHAFWLVGAWVAWELLNLFLSGGTGISYWSHVGGLIAGAGLVVVLRRPGVKLFQKHVAPSSKAPR
jgi:membrane associated rhomboid family serine protease